MFEGLKKKAVETGTQITVGAGLTAVLVPTSELYNSLITLHMLTGAKTFSDAVEVVWFKFDPRKDRQARERCSLLTTVWRAARDGNVKPPFDLEEEYEKLVQAAEAHREPDHGAGLAPGR